MLSLTPNRVVIGVRLATFGCVSYTSSTRFTRTPSKLNAAAGYSMSRLAQTGKQAICALFWTCCVIGFPTAGQATDVPRDTELTGIVATPSDIEFQHKFDYVQILLTGQLKSGGSVDLTRVANLVDTSDFVSVDGSRLVRPATDGTGRLTFTYSGQSVTIPVQVTGTAKPVTVSFVQDIMPVLSKLGCNAGTCHGSKNGKNGFKLSLRGYDPLFDHRALTDDVAARRFNRAAPDQSLMLLKASGSIPHVGNVRTRPGEHNYELLRTWVEQGVPLDLDSPRVSRIDLLPTDPVLPRSGASQQMVVIATFTDGTVRDVTQEAFIESGNIEVVEADDHGVITALRQGEAPILARYEGAYIAATLTVMGDRTGFVWNNPETHNYIDQHVYQKLQRVKLLPSEVCSDSEFLRRVYLDLTGVSPTADEVRRFLSDTTDSRTKRDRLVDHLVGSGSYVEHWTNKWSDMLQVNRKFLGEEGAIALRNWIKDCVARNKPYNQFVYEIITATGSNLDNPPSGYWKILRDPTSAMENTTHLFLATRFSCNKCHDHPFERWTQDQYYDLAAFFSQVGRKPDPQFADKTIEGTAVDGAAPLVEVVFDTDSGEITHARTGQIASPIFPFEHSDLLSASAPRRHQLAHWITSKENPYFARSYVNRLWGYLFGRGIIDPIDDIRAGNPPTNPGLLQALTHDCIEHDFDLQHMLRTICKSRTYQHSIQTNGWNKSDQINYSHAIPRRLPAEVLFDAIHQATGSLSKIEGLPAGFRAAELPDAGIKLPFLDDFGRPARESACECERSSGMVLGPVMKLVNGPTVANAIADPENALFQLVDEEESDQRVVEEMFLRFLARPASPAEVDLGMRFIQEAAAEQASVLNKLAAYEDSLPNKQRQWEQDLVEPGWTVLDPQTTESDIPVTFLEQDDHSILVSGKQAQGSYQVVADSDLNRITGIRLEALPDETLPSGGPGLAANGNFVLSEFQVHPTPQSDPDSGQLLRFLEGAANHSQQGMSVALAIDGDTNTGWAIDPRPAQRHVAVFQLTEALDMETPISLKFSLIQKYVDGLHCLGKFRLSATNATHPLRFYRLPQAIGTILATPADQRTEEQRVELTDYFRSQDEELTRLMAAKELVKNNGDPRLTGVQDLAWALINNPAFLFNR